MHRLFPFAFLPLIPSASASAASPPNDLIYGHYEINIDYRPVASGNPDDGWLITASYDEDDDFSSADGLVRLDAETTRFFATPNTLQTIPNPAGIFGRFGPPGTPIWVLPQDNILGSNFLGIRTTMPVNQTIFQTRVGDNYTLAGQGTVSLRLVSVTGTGPDAGGKFATWKTESLGTTVFSFDTTNGITAADEIPSIPVYSHTHYNWGLTKPGTYQVTFEAKGRLISGQFTSARKTFTFVVPFSGRVETGGQLWLVGEGNGKPGIAIGDAGNAVGYQTDRAMLEARTPAGGGFPGAQWEMPLTLSSRGAAIPNGVGISPEVLAAGLPAGWSDVAVRLTGVRGPGNFALLDAGGGVLMGDADGIDGSDAIGLPAETDLPVKAVFTGTGIYRATFVVTGLFHGQAVEGEPVVVTFGAGMGPDFDYAAWAASFEKTAGLPAGALADKTADFDHDGLPNLIEFAFFWHGLDPARPDGFRMPRAFPTSEGFGVVEFLRDTWKDRLDETKWRIVPETSKDLKTWHARSSRVPGFPMEIFEAGAEEGNAVGPILKRRLRVMPAVQDKAFFRFRVTSP